VWSQKWQYELTASALQLIMRFHGGMKDSAPNIVEQSKKHNQILNQILDHNFKLYMLNEDLKD
jgi:hypothetical protein